jgi:hypothetical protein
MGTHRESRHEVLTADSLSARLEIRLRGAVTTDDWTKRLQQLRVLDFDSANVRVKVAQLLSGCGFPHTEEHGAVVEDGAAIHGVNRLRLVTRWRPEHINEELLLRLQTLQKTVKGLDEDNILQSVASFRKEYEQALAARPRKVVVSLEDSKRAAKNASNAMVKSTKRLVMEMENYLRERSLDEVVNPQEKKNAPGEYLGKLFRAVSGSVGHDRERFSQVMRQLARSRELRHRVPAPSAPRPDDVLRQLLDFSAKDGIEARLSFDENRVPVLALTPRDPIAALLLRAHQARTLSTKSWAQCAWCGEQFVQRRKDQRTCPKEKCRNNLKVKEYRVRKEERERRTQHAKKG